MDNITCLFAVEAEQLFYAGLIDDAIEICQQGLREYPEYPLAYIILSDSYKQKEEYQKAHNVISYASEKFPRNKNILKCKDTLDSIAKENTLNIISTDESDISEIIFGLSRDTAIESEPSYDLTPQKIENIDNPFDVSDSSFVEDDINEESDIDTIDLSPLETSESENFNSLEETELITDNTKLIEVPDTFGPTESIVDEDFIPEFVDNIQQDVSGFNIENLVENENITENEIIETVSFENEEMEELVESKLFEKELIQEQEIIPTPHKEIEEIEPDNKFDKIEPIETTFIEDILVKEVIDNKEITSAKPFINEVSATLTYKASQLDLIPGLDSLNQLYTNKLTKTIIHKVFNPEYPEIIFKSVEETRPNSNDLPKGIDLSILAKQLNELSKNTHIEEDTEEYDEDETYQDVKIFSETLATIYEKQGAYDKAIKSYNALCSTNKAKIPYYQEKIKQLEEKKLLAV